ncbi:hypothetical protein [Microcoleus sp. AR_TQ3_B6]
MVCSAIAWGKVRSASPRQACDRSALPHLTGWRSVITRFTVDRC